MYIDNEKLLEEVVEYKKTGKMSNELGKMVLDIARNFSTVGSFAGYTWTEDMIGEAVLTCVKYLKSFNPDKSNNPFAYITTICKNAFIAYIKSQNKHSKIKDTLYCTYDSLHSDDAVSIDYTTLRTNY